MLYSINKHVYVIKEDNRYVVGSNNPVVLRLYLTPESVLIYIEKTSKYLRLKNEICHRSEVVEIQFLGESARRRYDVLSKYIESLVSRREKEVN